LAASTDDVEPKLTVEGAKEVQLEKLQLTEGSFKFLLNDDEMAEAKLADGIRRFAADARKLEAILRDHL
jgi:transaldolase